MDNNFIYSINAFAYCVRCMFSYISYLSFAAATPPMDEQKCIRGAQQLLISTCVYV